MLSSKNELINEINDIESQYDNKLNDDVKEDILIMVENCLTEINGAGYKPHQDTELTLAGFLTTEILEGNIELPDGY